MLGGNRLSVAFFIPRSWRFLGHALYRAWRNRSLSRRVIGGGGGYLLGQGFRHGGRATGISEAPIIIAPVALGPSYWPCRSLVLAESGLLAVTVYGLWLDWANMGWRSIDESLRRFKEYITSSLVSFLVL